MYNFQFGRYNLEGLFGEVLDLWIWSAFHKATHNFETCGLVLRILGTDIWISKLSTASFAVTSAVYDGSVTHSIHFVYWSTIMRKRSNRYGTLHGSPRPTPSMGVKKSLRHPWRNISGNSPHDDLIPIEHPQSGFCLGHFGDLKMTDQGSTVQPLLSILLGGGGDEILLITVVSIPVEYFINVCELFPTKPARVCRWPSKEQHTYPRFDSIHQLVVLLKDLHLLLVSLSHWWVGGPSMMVPQPQ